MMSLWKWVGVLAGAAVLVAAGQVLLVAYVDSQQARRNAVLLTKDRSPNDSRAAVVYYSRSGNTALMAQRIAERRHAMLYRLEAPDYQLGLLGWGRAMADARKHEAVIAPKTIDLGPYDAVYLGSPIWLYSPAPPIWQFVELNRFDNKDVILFNTFNSQFKPEFIEAFRARVLQRGARSFQHRYVRRGRMGGQLSTEELLRAVDEAFPVKPQGARLGGAGGSSIGAAIR